MPVNQWFPSNLHFQRVHQPARTGYVLSHHQHIQGYMLLTTGQTSKSILSLWLGLALSFLPVETAYIQPAFLHPLFHTTWLLDTLTFLSLWFSRSQDVLKRTIVHLQAHRTLQLPSVSCHSHSTKHASGTPQTDKETRSTPPSPIPYPTLARSISSIISHNHPPTHSDLHQTSP